MDAVMQHGHIFELGRSSGEKAIQWSRRKIGEHDGSLCATYLTSPGTYISGREAHLIPLTELSA